MFQTTSGILKLFGCVDVHLSDEPAQRQTIKKTVRMEYFFYLSKL